MGTVDECDVGFSANRIASKAGVAMVGLAASLALSGPVAAIRLPPVSNDPNRCERGFVGNTIGQVTILKWASSMCTDLINKDSDLLLTASYHQV